MESTSFLHSGNVGDVWAAIPAMRGYWVKTGKKVDLYLGKDFRAEYYKGAVHPTRSESGEFVMLNQKMIDMMIPLLLAQPFINKVEIWNNEEIRVDLNRIRFNYVGMPGLSINRWYFYLNPDFQCDLSKQWLDVPDAEKDFAKNKILINRTERYKSDFIDYHFMKPYEDDCLFIGTTREWNIFCMNFDLEIRKLNVDNFLQYAQAIKQSKFYIGNQSQGFQLAEGLKHPRILEVCGAAPNVIPIGEKAYDFLAQYGLEWSFHDLNGTTEQWFKQKIASGELASYEKVREREAEITASLKEKLASS